MSSEITLKITLLAPPKEVGFSLQKGKDENIDYQVSDGRDIRFRFSVRVKPGSADRPNFLGEYTQGTLKERFVYIRVGEYAGQKNTEWARRVKIHLSSISWEQVNQVLTDGNSMLAASYQASDQDGGPSCASVPLVGDGWQVVKTVE